MGSIERPAIDNGDNVGRTCISSVIREGNFLSRDYSLFNRAGAAMPLISSVWGGRYKLDLAVCRSENSDEI